MNLRDWPVPVIVVVIIAVMGVGYVLEGWVDGAWRTVFFFVVPAIILVLGVTLADRLMSNGDKDDARRSRE